MSNAPNEPLSSIHTEKGLLDGFVLGGAAYGILLTLFVQCVSALTQNPRAGRIRWGYVVYIIFMFALGNVGYFTRLRFIQTVFIDNRNSPQGGPIGWDAANYS